MNFAPYIPIDESRGFTARLIKTKRKYNEHMRILLKDQDNDSIFVMDASIVAYAPGERRLSFLSPSDQNIAIVCGISRTSADSITQTLFKTGKADLSELNASLIHIIQEDARCASRARPIEPFPFPGTVFHNSKPSSDAGNPFILSPFPLL